MIPPPITTASALRDHVPLLSSRSAAVAASIRRPSAPITTPYSSRAARGADLLVGDVVRDRCRIALERVAPAAAARHPVDVDVARLDRGREHRGSTSSLPSGRRRMLLDVRAGCRRRRARTAAVSARSERTISDVSGVRQRQTRSIARPPRCSPGAARVGHEPVALDDDRELATRRPRSGCSRRGCAGFVSPSLPSHVGVPPQVPTTSS